MQSILKEVESWLDEVVIGLKLCPFAKQPRLKKQIHICISKAESIEELMLCVVEQSHQLEKKTAEELETSLIVIPDLLDNFDNYLDSLFLAEQVLDAQGWQGIFQIASFHPRYQFEGTALNDIENLTNKAPYPIFHILREASVSKAADAYGNTALIPEKNKETIANLSTQRRRQLFKNCD